jgi:chromate reductase
MKVLAISGSLRAAAYNTALLRAAAELAPEGVEVELYDGLELLPAYNEEHDTDTPPAEVARLREAIAAADAVLFATPEYNGSMPGHVKQALDWASRPHRASALWGKPVAEFEVDKHAVGVESLRCLAHRELLVEDACAGESESFAEMVLGPDRAVVRHRGADHRDRLAPQG